MAREAYVFDEGRAKGEAKGRAEGEAKGRAEGEAKLITSMLKNGASMEFIAKYTGLSVEEISKLKKGK